jgi:dGTP triphosphohydrolase
VFVACTPVSSSFHTITETIFTIAVAAGSVDLAVAAEVLVAEALPEDFQPQLSFDGMERTVCDYIAGMTDNYAVDKYTEIFIPTGWHVRG